MSATGPESTEKKHEDEALITDLVNQDYSPQVYTAILMLLIKSGEANKALLLTDKAPIDINLVDNEGLMVLHHAASHFNVKLARILIKKHGANVDVFDRNNQTPLHHVAKHEAIFTGDSKGHVKMAKMLVDECKADINAVDVKGNTALHLAVSECSMDLIHFLATHGANLVITNEEGDIPLALAKSKNPLRDMAVIEFLLSYQEVREHPKAKQILMSFAEKGRLNYAIKGYEKLVSIILTMPEVCRKFHSDVVYESKANLDYMERLARFKSIEGNEDQNNHYNQYRENRKKYKQCLEIMRHGDDKESKEQVRRLLSSTGTLFFAKQDGVLNSIPSELQKLCRYILDDEILEFLHERFSALYTDLTVKLLEAKKLAQTHKKPLLILIGESHDHIPSFCAEILLLYAARIVNAKYMFSESRTTHPIEIPFFLMHVAIGTLSRQLGYEVHDMDDVMNLAKHIHSSESAGGEEEFFKRNEKMTKRMIQNLSNADQPIIGIVGADHLYGLNNETELAQHFYVFPINACMQRELSSPSSVAEWYKYKDPSVLQLQTLNQNDLNKIYKGNTITPDIFIRVVDKISKDMKLRTTTTRAQPEIHKTREKPLVIKQNESTRVASRTEQFEKLNTQQPKDKLKK